MQSSIPSCGFKQRVRAQFPLKLCGAWSARKFQGVTADEKAADDLEKGS